MKNQNDVVVQNKTCHSQKFLLGISHIRFWKKWLKRLFKQENGQKGDPRQHSSGMTPLFHHGGFTLIELLVVVLIIGVLAAVALPQYQLSVWKTRYAGLKNNVKTIVQAEEAYYLANGKYTNNLSDLDIVLPADAHCYVQGTAVAGATCTLYKGENIFLEYHQRFLYTDCPFLRICRAYSKDLNDISNKVCASEGAKLASDTQAYRYYQYQ